MRTFIFSIFLALSFTVSAEAATYTVCPSGCDYTTLSSAASNVPDNANHTISVAAGTYSGFTDTRSGVAPGYRHWLANGTVTITSAVILRASYVKFEGFTINGATNPLYLGRYVNDPGPDTGDHIWVYNNTIVDCIGTMIEVRGNYNTVENNDISGMYSGGGGDADGIRPWGTGHTFKGNYYHNLLLARVGSSHVDFFQTWQGPERPDRFLTDAIVEYNYVFMGSDDTGQLLEAGSDSISRTGFMIGGTNNLTIRNNIIMADSGMNQGESGADPNESLKVYNNTFVSDITFVSYAGGGFAQFAGSTVGATLRNNIFIDYNNSSNKRWMLKVEGSYTGSNNLFYVSAGTMDFLIPWTHRSLEQWQAYTGQETDSMVADPLFVTNYTDLHLQSDSPAKDAGTTIVSVTDDYDGTSRPQGSYYDIGAYEYTTSTSAPMPPTGLKVVSSN